MTSRRPTAMATTLGVLAACSLLALGGPSAPPARAAAGTAAPGPSVHLISGPADRTPARRAAFTFEADEPDASYSVRLDDRRWTAYDADPWATFTKLRDGVHRFAVRAKSPGSTPGPVERSSFVVDSDAAAPTMPRTQRPSGPSSRAATGSAAAAATVFSSGFESGNFSGWTVGQGGTGRATVQQTVVRSGAWAAQFETTADSGSRAYARHRLAAAAPDLTSSATLRVAVQGASGGNVPLLRLLDDSGTRTLSLYRANGSGDVWVQYAGAHRRTTARMPLNSWRSFAVNTTANSLQVTMDGTIIHSATAGVPATRTVQLGNEVTGQAGRIFADDVTLEAPTSTQEIPATLIADNQNRRILITDYDGRVLWKFDNPTGESSAYSGPLGVRWMDNGHILATFGTGKVGEIDPATKSFVWITAGYNQDWFQSPYDAQILPDGNLAVASARNEGGRVAVYNRSTGALVWKKLVNYAHMVEVVPAGQGTNTSRPTLLMAGFSDLYEVVYAPGQSTDKQTVWRWDEGSNVHRAILDRDGRSIVLGNWDDLVKVARPTQNITWSRFQGNPSNGEVRGVAMTESGGYVIGYRIWRGASQLRFTNASGVTTSQWSTLSDGSRLNLPWGVRTIRYPG